MNTTPGGSGSGIDFTSFLKLMAHQKASDLFITAGMPPSMKVHGKISPITQNPLTPQQVRDRVLNVMTPPQREEFERTHECNILARGQCPEAARSPICASRHAHVCAVDVAMSICVFIGELVLPPYRIHAGCPVNAYRAANGIRL